MKAEIKSMLIQAHEKIRAARILLEGGAWGDAASRAYYAAFHAVSAVLLSGGETYSSHAQVIGAFNKNFVHAGVFPPEFTKLLTRLFEDRQSGDYDFLPASMEDDARQDVTDAEIFVETIEKFLSSVIINQEKVRVRFAPSPTGELHLGNARTAIFNWLFARKMRGTFILRIEDTDQERSKAEYTQLLMKDLRWLGLDWDEGPEVGGSYGPYLQSERLEIYKAHAKRLEEKGLIYSCYCSQEELEARRLDAQAKGIPPRYDNRCRFLTEEEKKNYEREGRKSVVRFKVEPQKVKIQDLVRGEVIFDTALFGDFVIFKSDGFPTFHFAVAVDDGLMKVSHVIRGEDHLSNTPRHILLFQAMGFDVPQFAHLSMIMGPDGTRLSKRHGATSVGFYNQEGFLPEALLNYLTLLGWSSGDDQEIFSLEELVQKFSIERIVKSSAIFNPQKLHWVGSQHLRKISVKDVSHHLQKFFPEILKNISLDTIYGKVELLRERTGTLQELMKELEVFLNPPSLEAEVIKNALSSEAAGKILKGILDALEKDWTEEAFPVKSLSLCQKALEVSGQEFYPLFRLVLTGHPHGPELKDVCPVMGKDEVIRRLRKALTRVEEISKISHENRKNVQ
ncbi:MAG: glutamate--tRNA ligase [Chlamydiae bacterium]|nr:glutamate--tRNA ligase [Chlamydiota bacterium]MBI3276795.1 glutamate--tRNA ligase [Chlamydiota bacterium]